MIAAALSLQGTHANNVGRPAGSGDLRPASTDLAAWPDQASASLVSIPRTHVLAETRVIRPKLSSSQLAAWKKQVSTAQGRAAILDGLHSVFGNTVQFGVGSMPTAQPTSGHAASVSPNAQIGVTSDHFWFIVTDYEVRQGVGTLLRAACFRVLPLVGAFICGSIITAVLGASYGTANNHGVWGAVYWWTPRIVIGRW
jgi:hypothetical protein